jgi:hypothetical protein
MELVVLNLTNFCATIWYNVQKKLNSFLVPQKNWYRKFNFYGMGPGTAVINTHMNIGGSELQIPAGLWLDLHQPLWSFGFDSKREEPGKTGRHPVLKYRIPHGSQPRPGWVGSRSPLGWWLGLHQPSWSFGFDSQT